MWQSILLALLVTALFACGMVLGWTARDRVAAARDEKPMPLREVPLKEPINLAAYELDSPQENAKRS